ncbi:hypothetical protein, variant 2 [Exophiala oligosperma]|uniref:Uncharacterized protein n=1 Tax=Exophiala oligosperma TaxID=215243 RepID=A0A0D2DBT6_9EURO|nr:hypothetical protein, variant 1 [Exophiala oligosperma]XP_016260745.1 hypothetical protein, variant 2 [Exophiala oligosperma]KIW40528.1 hypothetical protein, variant 1 [Exophiala oligosperma]KIW40529.1 hypothetical protein, variant 2 [Exophiala oligosperma]
MPPANLLRQLKGKSYEVNLEPGSAPVSYDNTDLRDVQTLVARPIESYTTGTAHVIFMPSIEKRLERGFAPDQLIDDLSSRFNIPEFFFDVAGWNANGFFRSSELGNRDPSTSAPYSYCTSSRFLTKNVMDKVSVGDQNTVPGHTSDAAARRHFSEFSDAEDEKWTWTSADTGPPQASTPSSNPPSYRSLTRNPNPKSPSYKYTWDFMGFCTYWRRTAIRGGGGQYAFLNIIVCFDLSKEIKKKIMAAISNARFDIAQGLHDPFCLLNVANNVMIEHFHRSLWSFQPPIRNVEKTRLEGWVKTLQNDGGDTARAREVTALVAKYAAMHELNRHVHHIAEAMQVASNTLKNITEAHDSLCSATSPAQHTSDNISNNLRFQTVYTDNLRCRADAFVDRMKNETRFISNRVAIEDNDVSKGILAETRNDGRVLSETVSVLTLLFLPGTFVSGFFGMNFFSVDGNGWKWLPNFWMFFAFTAPITFAGLVLFMFEVNVVGWSRRNFSKPVKNWYLDKQRKRSRSRNQRRRNTQTETTHAGTNSQTQTNVNMDTNTIGQNDGVV